MGRDALKLQRDELNDRISLLKKEAVPLREQLGNIDRQLSVLYKEVAELEDKIRAMGKRPSVSDHAVIRYLERKHGFDFEKTREEMLTPTVIAAMEMGAEGVKTLGGTLKIRGKTVVTYIN